MLKKKIDRFEESSYETESWLAGCMYVCICMYICIYVCILSMEYYLVLFYIQSIIISTLSYVGRCLGYRIKLRYGKCPSSQKIAHSHYVAFQFNKHT